MRFSYMGGERHDWREREIPSMSHLLELDQIKARSWTLDADLCQWVASPAACPPHPYLESP